MCPGHTALCRPQGVVPRPRKALLGGSESRLQTPLGPSHKPCGPQGRPPVQAHILIAGQPSCSSSGQGVKEPVSSDWENHSTQCWGGASVSAGGPQHTSWRMRACGRLETHTGPCPHTGPLPSGHVCLCNKHARAWSSRAETNPVTIDRLEPSTEASSSRGQPD